MFVRVAACSIAAFLLVAVAPSRADTGTLVDTGTLADTGALADTDVSAAMNATAPAPNDAQVPAENSARDDIPMQLRLAALDPAEPAIKPPAVAEPFGLDTMPWFGGGVFTKWNGVTADIRAESDILARCRETMKDCPPAAQKFLAIVAAGHAQTGLARIGVINRAINLAIQPMSDLKQWGVADRWSAPLETFSTGRGDCEDYAIAKFVALTAAGVAPEDVKLVIVHDLAVGEGHAVVATHVGGHWVVLDNRWLALVEDTKMRRMVPMSVIDYTGVRAYLTSPGGDVAAAPAALGLPFAN
jgi:predicted transglutaminase-like cysteine proteinase